jgi:uncharacterized protein YgiM (DUF1202 family)
MKNNLWLIFSVILSTSLLAQQPTNPPATSASTSTNTAAKSEKKKSKKKSAAKKKQTGADLKTVPLVAGPAVVIASNVNVRGQAKLNSEVVTRGNKGQLVMVLEEITLKNSGPDEPSAWAKIVLPTNAHPWVSAMFVDMTNQTVTPKKLQIRAGPGEEYSVLGTLIRGDKITQVSTKPNWIQIEAPASAFAFVAAQYLSQETPGVTNVAEATPVTTEPPPTPTPVAEPTPVATAPTEVTAPTPAPETAAPTTNASTPAPAVPEEPPPPRIVQREGVVRGTISIQAPTHFELVSPDNGRAINYLYTTSRDLDLRRYKGLRIIVTGEEGLDERWRNTPVITIQRIQVVE